MAHVSFSLGNLEHDVASAAAKFTEERFIRRLWEKDYSVWRTEEVHRKSILNRLGWLMSIEWMSERIDELDAFGKEVAVEGFSHAVVLGMGGSSLCPDVCRKTFGSKRGAPRMIILDSTNPTTILRVERSINLDRTLFIVSSKSGTTTETNMFYQYFFDTVSARKGTNAGRQFVAITDRGSSLESIGRSNSFRKIFLNPDDIGGRYSALSYFGLVPMAVIGMDVRKILKKADEAALSCRREEIRKNPSALIGLAMGVAHRSGQGKLTFVASKGIGSFSSWVEQLIAESTGKEGRGIIPVEGEEITDEFSKDRLFVFLKLAKESKSFDRLQARIRKSGHPLIDVTLESLYDLGGEFFRWEFSTAVSAAVLNIDPFDEPNVKESKDNTVRGIEQFKTTGSLPQGPALAVMNGIQLFCDASYGALLRKTATSDTVSDLFAAHLANTSEGDYFAILAYVDQSDQNERILRRLQAIIGRLTQCATTVGFGPRYLHSTGQLHKGGSPNGVFLILTADEPMDVKIPGETFTFGILKNAQALGDFQSLVARSRRVVRVHLTGSVSVGLQNLVSAALNIRRRDAS